jgi:membrane protease YdiL (CAAX protease family)
MPHSMHDLSRWSPPAERSLPPFRIGDALGALGISALVYLVPGEVVLYLLRNWDQQIVAEVLTYLFLSLGVLLSAVVLVISRYPEGARALGFRWPGWETFATAALSVLPIYLGIGVLYALFSHFLPGFHLQGNAKEALPIGNHVSLLETIGLVAFAGILVPLTEETLFRGMLFGGLTAFLTQWLNRNLAVFIGAVISGCIFGLAHATPHTLPILAFVGICLAYVYYYSQSIYASMIVHGLFNTLAVVVLATSS